MQMHSYVWNRSGSLMFVLDSSFPARTELGDLLWSKLGLLGDFCPFLDWQAGSKQKLFSCWHSNHFHFTYKWLLFSILFHNYFNLIFLYLTMLYLILYTCRWTLESIGSLDPRKSALEDDFEEEEEKEEEEEHNAELENGTHEKVLLLLFYEVF